MHAYYYTEVDRPFDKVEEVVLRLVHRFGDWSTEAYRDGEALRLKMVVGGIATVAKSVTMTPGAPDRQPGAARIPLRWEATGSASLFPTMDADLTLVALGDDRTKIALQGNYRPPLGPVGTTLDRFVLHHLAESSVKHFVDKIVDAVAAVVEVSSD